MNAAIDCIQKKLVLVNKKIADINELIDFNPYEGYVERTQDAISLIKSNKTSDEKSAGLKELADEQRAMDKIAKQQQGNRLWKRLSYYQQQKRELDEALFCLNIRL